jgi:Fe-S-cluster containining protein
MSHSNREIHRQLKEAQKVDTIRKIQEFYSCPSECKGFCCEIFDIDMDIVEFDEIKKISKSVKNTLLNNIKQIGQEITYLNTYRVTTKPCPFLKNAKCSIYNKRPVPCIIYPFRYHDKAPKSGDVIIDYCPMGVNIICDWSIWSVLKAEFSNVEDDVVSEIRMENYKGILLAIKAVGMFKHRVTEAIINSNRQHLCVDSSLLDEFAQYLALIPEKNRIETREKFLRENELFHQYL